MAGAGSNPYHQQWPAPGAQPTAPSSVPATDPAPAPASVPSAAHPPPPGAVAYPHLESPNCSSALDEVRTIFITGLPEDVKERELQNLLRWLPGYEASQVNSKGEHPMGFALFSAPQLAISAKDALQDLVFDSELKSVLHTEMAKKNLFVKRGIVTDSNVYDQSKRPRTAGDSVPTGYSSPSPFQPPPAPIWVPHGYMAAPTPLPYDPYGGYHVPHVPLPVPMPAPPPIPAPSSYVPIQNIKDNPPCNTLFIGNLGENINEEELRGLFCMQLGFRQMKMLRQERHTVCFIEFEDVNSATNVHRNLQGAVIPSSGSIGMRIQFKEPVWEKKGFQLPYSRSRSQWSASAHDLSIAEMGCIMLFLLQQVQVLLHDRMHHATVACIHFIIKNFSCKRQFLGEVKSPLPFFR